MQHDCIAAVLYFMPSHHAVSAQLMLWVCTPGTADSILIASSKTPSRHRELQRSTLSIYPGLSVSIYVGTLANTL
jgi:hypothetical protein